MLRLGRATGDAMTALGIDRSHLFGFHTGNKIAAAIASQSPGRVGRLVLCGQTHSLIADQASRIAAFGPITDRYFGIQKRKIPRPPTRWRTSSGRMRSSLTLSAYGGTTVPSKSSGTHRNSGDTSPLVSWIYWKPSQRCGHLCGQFQFRFRSRIETSVCADPIIEVASKAEAHLGAQADRLAASMQNGFAATIEEGDREVLEMRTDEIFDLLSNFLASGKT